MQVVQHQHDGAVAVQTGDELPDRFEHPEAGLGRILQPGRWLQAGSEIVDLRQDIGHVACPDADIGKQCAPVFPTQCLAEDLHPGPVRRSAGFLMAAAP
jgi:hypothetical protein